MLQGFNSASADKKDERWKENNQSDLSFNQYSQKRKTPLHVRTGFQ